MTAIKLFTHCYQNILFQESRQTLEYFLSIYSSYMDAMMKPQIAQERGTFRMWSRNSRSRTSRHGTNIKNFSARWYMSKNYLSILINNLSPKMEVTIKIFKDETILNKFVVCNNAISLIGLLRHHILHMTDTIIYVHLYMI